MKHAETAVYPAQQLKKGEEEVSLSASLSYLTHIYSKALHIGRMYVREREGRIEWEEEKGR